MTKEKILSMTNGQHILYGMICSILVEEFNYDPSVEDSIKMIELIQHLDSPENCYDIFAEFYVENKTYILELASENNDNIKELI